MIRYKLFRIRKDGSLGPLFINARQRIPIGVWLDAETHHQKKGFAYRPGWHMAETPHAPHLSETGRGWYAVEVADERRYPRPASQGGEWILSDRIRVLGPAEDYYGRN